MMLTSSIYGIFEKFFFSYSDSVIVWVVTNFREDWDVGRYWKITFHIILLQNFCVASTRIILRSTRNVISQQWNVQIRQMNMISLSPFNEEYNRSIRFHFQSYHQNIVPKLIIILLLSAKLLDDVDDNFGCCSWWYLKKYWSKMDKWYVMMLVLIRRT